ncbi:hypothetical protein [Pontivivens ytuae]|uniref:Uncharacterized protein n=1 Tax=Pontivivens ytuae TaxID=2789856 RepID=A0A7S9LTX2_9RHOB|nr:hypothetical protein [Pontivivens ytuae]QPH55194.1 hypothetical protein I0K15_05495 [Pontivivens ytuae]
MQVVIGMSALPRSNRSLRERAARFNSAIVADTSLISRKTRRAGGL